MNVRKFFNIVLLFTIAAIVAWPQPCHADITSGLIGWWRFDEGSGTTYGDSSGNGITGSGTSGVNYVAGKIGPDAINLEGTYDGSSGTTQYAYFSGVPISGGYNTISFWMYWVGTYTNGFGEMNSSAGGCFNTVVNSSIIGFRDCDGDTLAVSTPGNLANNWHLITEVVYQGNASLYQLYIDGVLQTLTNNSMRNESLDTTLMVGAIEYTEYNDFNGYIDDLRVYNRQLSQNDVTQLYNYTSPDITTGLLLWWKLNDGSGTSATDSSGNGYAGSLNGTASWVAGKVWPYSVYVNDGSVRTGSGIWQAGQTTFTLSVWANKQGPGGNDPDAYLLSTGGAAATNNNTHLALCLSGTSPAFDMQNTSGTDSYASGGSCAATGTWHLYTGTFDGTTVSMYVDGALVGTTTASGGQSANPLYAGQWLNNPGVFYFNGDEDDVRVYNRALTAADVAALYAYTGIAAAADSMFFGSDF